MFPQASMSPSDSHPAVDKVPNKNHASDISNAVRYTRWLLTIIGIWPRVISNPTKIELCFSKLMLPLASLLMLTVAVHLILHVLSREVNGLEVIMLMGPIGFHVTNILKHLVMFLHSRLIKVCIEHMKTDWRCVESDQERDIMTRSVRIGHDVTIVSAMCMYSGTAFYHAVRPMLWSGESKNATNETTRLLAYPGTDRFLDIRIGYNYEIIFWTVYLTSFFISSVVTGACNLAAIFVTHACGQIQIVMARLDGLLGNEDEEIDGVAVADRIAFIIHCHVRVLKFSSQIDQVLQEICLLEVVSSTIIICLTEYYCMTEWSNSDSVALITYAILFTSFSLNVYIYCHVGELLKDQVMQLIGVFLRFHQVRIAAYNLEWYRLPDRVGLALVMIIIVANYPPKLTAGKMIELSIYTFGTIMRTTLGYLNMLRTMTE